MFRVIGCITQQHDLRLVMLAALWCLLGCMAAMGMIWRRRVSDGRNRLFGS
jgi:NO-binding membrane sensor protein with MHYT domain